jgi:SAM-dependent methyltransferase
MEDVLYHTFYEVEKVHWWCVSRKEILVALTHKLLPNGGKILDVGCGTGFFIESVGPQFETWGLDQSPLAVSMCRERGLARVFEGSALDLSAVAEERFDAIFMLDVLEHLDDDAGALEQAKRLLKPGGLIIATVPAFEFLWSKHDDITQHKRRYVRDGLAKLMRKAQLETLQLTYFNSYLFPIAVMHRLGRKWLGTDDGVEFNIPTKALNNFLGSVFRAETQRVLKSGPHGAFPLGLSLLAVGRVATPEN